MFVLNIFSLLQGISVKWWWPWKVLPQLLNQWPPWQDFMCYDVRGWRTWVKIMYKFDDLYQCTAHWLPLYEGVIIWLSSATIDSYSFYDGPVAIQYETFWRRKCRVSDTQVAVKAHGSLVLSLQLYLYMHYILKVLISQGAKCCWLFD